MPASLSKRLVQSVQLRGRHAQVYGALACRQYLHTGGVKKLLELRPQIIIHNLTYLIPALLCVVHIVGRIGKNHIGQPTFQHSREAFALGGIAAEQPVSSHHHHIASDRHRQGWSSWHIVFVHQTLRLEIGQDPIQFLGPNPSVGKSNSSFSKASNSLRSFCGSQSAFIAIWLSAIRYARFWVSVRPRSTLTGTSFNPIRRAAKYLPWPARMVPFSSTRNGWVTPYCAKLPTNSPICSSGCVRA